MSTSRTRGCTSTGSSRGRTATTRRHLIASSSVGFGRGLRAIRLPPRRPREDPARASRPAHPTGGRLPVCHPQLDALRSATRQPRVRGRGRAGWHPLGVEGRQANIPFAPARVRLGDHRRRRRPGPRRETARPHRSGVHVQGLRARVRPGAQAGGIEGGADHGVRRGAPLEVQAFCHFRRSARCYRVPPGLR
jgi:hypothetical protein